MSLPTLDRPNPAEETRTRTTRAGVKTPPARRPVAPVEAPSTLTVRIAAPRHVRVLKRKPTLWLAFAFAHAIGFVGALGGTTLLGQVALRQSSEVGRNAQLRAKAVEAAMTSVARRVEALERPAMLEGWVNERGMVTVEQGPQDPKIAPVVGSGREKNERLIARR